MQLADAAWAALDAGAEDATVWEIALDRCRVETADSHESRFSSLAPVEQAVLRLAATDGALFGRGAELLAVSRSSAQRTRKRLVDLGQMTVRDDAARVVDPLYADWIRNRFPL